MPTVTVPGAVSSGNTYSTITLQFATSQNAAIATQLLQTIYAAAANNTLVANNYAGNATPSPGFGALAELVVQSGVATVPGGYLGVVDASTSAETIYGGSSQNQTVLAGQGGLTYLTNTGAGSLITGGGNNLVAAPTVSGGNWDVIFDGAGANTVFGTTGNFNINAGTGQNLIFLGSGADTVQSYGTDTIVSGSGASTVTTHAPGALVFGNSGPSYVTNLGGADTIVAGSGPETIFAGSSGGLYFGNQGQLIFVNANGASTVVAGAGNETLYGGSGNGVYFNVGGGQFLLDGQSGQQTVVGASNAQGAVLFSETGGSITLFGDNNQNLLVSGAGNVSLNGAFASGANVYFAGTGSDTMIGGAGNDVMIGYTGNATMQGGAGANIFGFQHNLAGGQDLIQDFTNNDQLYLLGYAGTGGNNGITNQTVNGGSTVLTLSDGTVITLAGVSNLNPNQVHST